MKSKFIFKFQMVDNLTLAGGHKRFHSESEYGQGESFKPRDAEKMEQKQTNNRKPKNARTQYRSRFMKHHFAKHS